MNRFVSGFFAARRATHIMRLLLSALLAAQQTAWSQAPPSGVAPLAQTVQGVTVRLTQARWRPLAGIIGAAPGVFIPDQALVISGTVDGGPNSHPPDGKTEMDFVSVAALGPQGQRLAGQALRDGTGWYFAGLDPRWKAVQIQFERSDPSAAPGDAFGNFQGNAEYLHIASPVVDGAPVTVQQTQATAHGTRITLERVRLRQFAFGGHPSHQLQLLLAWEPPADRPDTRIRFTLRGRVQEEGGGTIGSIQGDGSETDDLDPYMARQTARYAGTPFTLNLHLFRAPAPGRRLTVSVDYWETSPALRRPEAFTHFAFPLALAHLTPPAHSPHRAPVAIQQRGGLLAVAEDVRPQFGQEDVRLWLHDARPQDWGRNWMIAQASVQNPQTGQQQSILLPYPPSQGRGGDFVPNNRLFWKSDGEPLGPDDAGYRLEFSPSQFQPRPSTVTLTMALELHRRTRYAFDLPDIPVPASTGPTRPVGRRAVVPGLGVFEAVAISRFDQDHPLMTRFGGRSATGQTPSGMALALRFTPERSDAPPPDSSLLLDEMTTRDTPGSNQTREETASPVWTDLVDSAGSMDLGQAPPTPAGAVKDYFVTLPLLRAPEGRTLFTLHLAFDQVLVTDRRGMTFSLPVAPATPPP